MTRQRVTLVVQSLFSAVFSSLFRCAPKLSMGLGVQHNNFLGTFLDLIISSFFPHAWPVHLIFLL